MEQYRTLSELNEKDLKILNDLTLDNLKIDSGNQMVWEDDSCFNIIINGIKVSFWYVDPIVYADMMYANILEEAKVKTLNFIKDIIEQNNNI